MMRIGLVGIGFMGMIHYHALSRIEGARVAAICSRDPKKRAGDWTSIRGNFGPPGSVVDLGSIARHEHFDDLIADPDVDLVDLCVPNDEHARMAVAALRAGKDVLVEKPIAVTLADADAMIAAAGESGRRLLVAHILPFFPEFDFVRAASASGEYGKPLAGHFARVISRPDWSSGVEDDARSGGPAIDLHIHDTHFVDLVFGPPRAVRSVGVIDGGTVRHLSTQYLYDSGGAAVSAVSGAICMSGRPFMHGYEVAFERATVRFEFENLTTGAAVKPLTVIGPDGNCTQPELGPGDPIDAFARELSEAADAVRTGRDSPLLDAARARRALALCLAEIEATKDGGEVATGF